jgi:predicted ATPase
MFLRELHIKNYMIHQDTKVQLQPLTVFVGPNGGGKSASFDALLNFSMVSRGNLRQAFVAQPNGMVTFDRSGSSAASLPNMGSNSKKTRSAIEQSLVSANAEEIMSGYLS